MEYHEAVDTLEGLRRVRPKLGTETTASLLGFVGSPHEEFTAVQVAGSNGKGSTARLLDGILREHGLDVGLYTSPDLNDLRERVRVGGRKIPRDRVVEFVEEVWPFVVDRSAAGDAPTFFEVATAMALWHFGQAAVDVAVLEVGIGGRYDATSVVDPAAAAVTTVSLEHTDLLGETVEEIARDKVHVAPAARPLVTGATGGALEAIRAETDVVTVAPAASGDRAGSGGPAAGAGREGEGEREKEGTDVRVRETGMASLTESTVRLTGPDWSVETQTSLLGTHQAVNAGIAAALARQVADPTPAEIAAGIRNTHWPGRFEIVEDTPLVVLDGAHNPAACRTLASLLARYDYADLHLVFGAMRDKDHAAMVDALPAPDRVALAEPAVDRAQAVGTLAAVFEHGTDATVEACDSVLGALGGTLAAAGKEDCVLVTGSLYTVGEARDHWTRTPRAVRTDSTAGVRSVMRAANVPAATRRTYAGSGVHRTVTFHARRSRAAELKEATFSVGGRCVVSGIEAADQHVEVVLTGTATQFTRLVGTLEDGDPEQRHLAEQLTRALGFDGPGPGQRGARAGAGAGAGAGVGEAKRESQPETRAHEESDYPWNRGTAVMGVLDVTPDASRDGTALAVGTAVDRARRLAAAGADVVDVCGVSTRPGTDPVPVATERERVRPVVEGLAGVDALVSVDTREPAVAEAALGAGADMVRDGTGLADAAMRRVVTDHSVPVALVYGTATSVGPDCCRYDDVVGHAVETLTERLLLAGRAGIDRSQVLVDPGLGVGKGPAESFELLDRIDELRALGTPVMVGHSQGSMFAGVADGDDRLAPTVAGTALAAERGADMVRVHDVASNAAAIRTTQATLDGR